MKKKKNSSVKREELKNVKVIVKDLSESNCLHQMKCITVGGKHNIMKLTSDEIKQFIMIISIHYRVSKRVE